MCKKWDVDKLTWWGLYIMMGLYTNPIKKDISIRATIC